MGRAKTGIDPRSGVDVDVGAMLENAARRELAARGRSARRGGKALPPAAFAPSPSEKPSEGIRSFFFDPLALEANYYGGGVQTVSPYYGRLLTCRILRGVAEKAWIINLCISTTISQARPYFREAIEDGQRGFRVWSRKAREAGREMAAAEKKEARRLAEFFLNTGDADDPGRIDDLDKYATKIIRDLYQLDQISTELQRTRGGELCAFWAVDAATIEVALPSAERATGVRYAQVINHVPYAHYGRDDLIFDCMNPRTDIEKAGYGYSVVEQAIDLVTSSINTFMYNAGFFTENRLPRGMLLLNGSADLGEVEDIEDYISNLMSGQPTSQWRIPIIPSGKAKGGEGRVFDWVSLQGNNKEMEYQAWFDLQLSAITAMFRKSLEELGLHSAKSQPMINSDAHKAEASRSLGLGDLLAFMQKHFNQILRHKNPDYVFEFAGYERDDIRMMADIDKAELDTWKTLNEKRLEKGAEPLDMAAITNPADLPMSPQAVQLWQAAQGAGGGGGSPFDSEGGDFGEGDGEGAGDPEGLGGEGEPQGEGWGGIEAAGGGAVEKSLGRNNKNNAVRVTV